VYTYDTAGNRREVSATSGTTTVNAWYTYDGDNRVAVSDGSLVNGQIVVTATANSYAQTYDADGNVVSQLTVNAAGDTLVQRNTYDGRDELIRADYAVDLTTGGLSRGVEETRSYDADGHVLITDQYYALGTMLGARPNHKVNPYDPDSADSDSGTDVGGELDSATIDYYDSVGRLAEEQNFGHASGWDGSGGGTAPVTAPGMDATTFGSLGLQSEVVYQGPGGSAGYDADGDVVAYQYRDANGRVDQYAVTYLRKDGYLQSTTSGQNISNTPNVRPATDESVYDTRGNLVALAQHTQYAGGAVADAVRVFAYDGHGEIIERRDGTANGAALDQGSTAIHENQHYVYVNGQQVAHYDEGGTLDVLAEVTAFSNSTSGPGGYVVQAGDTLQSIAQAEYGDASLWYVIAQANALSSDNDLAIGQSLTIPQVTTNGNTATTFKPYDPSSIVGSTTPNLPVIAPPPPPPSSHCNVLAEIIVIVVVVVVSYFTAGALSGPAMSLGESILVGAAAGAAGSAAGQLAGDALGVHQGFSFGELALGALAARLPVAWASS
jgi:LysM repeat protein